MSRPRPQMPRGWLIRLLVPVFFLGAAWALMGQIENPQAYGTKMHIQRLYYEPPDQDKIKLELSGDKTTNVESGILINNAKIKSYSVAGGEPQLTAETPSCIFNFAASQISSTNLLQLRSGDSNFYVEGVGFLWQKTEPDLTLSNRVHTIIRQPVLANAAAKSNAAPTRTDVDSRWATFDTKNGLVVYHEQVRVANPQLHLTSAILTAKIAQGGSNNNQLDNIVAETNVIMDFIDESGRPVHATSEKAVYTRTTDPDTNDLLTLSLNPRLETTNGWATADVFVLNQTTRKIEGVGNCRFHSVSTPPAPGSTPKPESEITALSFDYDMNSGVVIFRDHVHAENPQIKVACEILTVKLAQGDAKTNIGALDNAVAENAVQIDYVDANGEKTHAIAQRAAYSSTVVKGVTNQVLDLTGNPVIERTNGWIMADFITMDNALGTIRGEGNHHTILKKQPGTVSKATPPASADTEIFSDHFDYSTKTSIAHYTGNARVLNPTMHLQCVQLMVKLPEGTNHAGRPDCIVAETNVIVDYFQEKGDKTHAAGGKMVFTHTVTHQTTTNEVLVMTGNPIIDMTSLQNGNTHATGDKIVYTSTVGGGPPSELVTLSGNPRIVNIKGVVTSDHDLIYDRLTQITRGAPGHNHLSFIIPAKTNHPPALTGASAP